MSAERDASTGTFVVEGHVATWRAETDGWLSASTPLGGSPTTLLIQQAAIPSPAKVAAGPSLRAELPYTGEPEPSTTALRSALERGLGILGGRCLAELPGGEDDAARDDAEARNALIGYASPYSWPWTANGSGWRCMADTRRLLQRVDVTLAASQVRFVATLVRHRGIAAISITALTHFLLALNSRLRLARGALDRVSVRLEVGMPARYLDARLIDHALGALVVGAGVARRECAALLDPVIAEAYCAFHHLTLDTDKEATS